MDEKITAENTASSGSESMERNDKVLEGLGDEAADLYLEANQFSSEEIAAERAVVRKKLDLIILPMICITYCLQFLDKSSLNYAAAYTLIPDLGLTGQRYSWVAAVFSFGFLFWALPANYLIQRLPVAKYTAITIMIWSILLCCNAAVTNYAGILVIRFLLGMGEAGISPGIMNIVAMFYTRSEQPLRMCVFLGFNGLSTILGALLAYALGHIHDNNVSTWQLIFMVIGFLNFIWCWIFLFFMPDSPTNARFFTHKQRVIAVERIAANMVGVKTKEHKPAQIWEACRDSKVWALTLLAVATGVINGGVSNFASSLIKGFGFSPVYTTLLQLPAGLVELIVVPSCGLAATYIKDVRCMTMILVSIIPLGGLFGIRFISLEDKWGLIACTWLQGIVGAPIVLCWNLLTTNIAGHTKRSTANGVWFLFYAAGQIAGPNIFFARERPRYFSAVDGLIICYCAIIVLAGYLWGRMAWENRQRDLVMGTEEIIMGADSQAIIEGFRDKTDKESKGFRYGL